MAKSAVKGSVKIVDRKHFKGDVAFIFGKRAASVTVGVFGVAGEEPATVRAKEGAAPTTLTVRDIAEIHEFGLGNCPERSFIRAYYDANRSRLIDALTLAMRKEVQRVIQSGTPMTDERRRSVLTKLGLLMQSEIQARMAAGIQPPNAEQTIKRKGSSTPLKDTGQLVSSIKFAVDLDAPSTGSAVAGDG